MAKRRKRRKRREVETEDIVNPNDRFSLLPEPLMLSILFLLPPVDAFHTSVLSNTWRRLWNSIPTQSFLFNFDMRSWERNLESEQKVQEFIIFVDESLEKLRSTEEKIKIETLSLHLGVAFNSANNLESHINRWMRLLAKHYIKELNITAALLPRYDLPKNVLSASSLSTLKIEGFRLLDSVALKGDFKFPCLEKLSLSRVQLSGLVAEKLLSSSLMLKQLDMELCVGLEDFSIPNLPKLSSAKLIKFYCKSLAIQASNLEVLHCYPFCDTGFNLGSFSCENLKELSLNIRDISGERIIKSLSTKLYFLETLYFKYDSGSPTFEISSRRLKSLTLHVEEAMDLVKVYAPNLHSYSYTGWSGLPSSCHIYASKLQTALCFAAIRGNNINTKWFLKLREYLTMFKHHVLALELAPYKVSFNPKQWTYMTSPFGANLDRLELDYFSSSHDYRALLNGLLWSAHPRVLSVCRIPFNQNLLEFLCKTFSNIKEIQKCRCNWKKLCWRRLLKDVNIKTGTHDRPKDLQIVEGKSVYESLPVLEENERVMFELTW